MKAVIDLPESTMVFGDDLTFELRGLLVEHAGANLRNNVCHGLLSAEACSSTAACVLLPLAVYLLLSRQANRECGKPTAE